MQTSWVALTLGLGLGACANLAGIEPGRLHEDEARAGSGSTAGSSTAGTSGSSAGAGAGASPVSGGSPSVGGGSAGQPPLAAGSAGLAQGGATSGGAGSGGTPGDPPDPCPAGMVESRSAQGVAYCIDAYETTNAAYKAFTQAHTVQNTTQVSACTGNASFVPDTACGGGFNDVPSASLPVVCVDWCDATAYCASSGKRLCGRVGGAPNPQADQADANASEWFAACTGPDRAATGGELCNDSQHDPNKPGPKAASSLPDCEADLGGLFNLSGNVAEWENSCASSGAAALCNIRGGSFQDGPFELQCSSANTLARNAASNAVGIRCCADAS